MPYHKDFVGHEKSICDQYLSGVSKEQLRIKYRCHFQQISQILRDRSITERTMSETHQLYKVDQGFFDTIDTPAKAYVLGFLWADGSNGKTGVISVTLSVRDRSVMELIRRALGSNHPIREYVASSGYGKGCSNVRLAISNKRLSYRLRELGMTVDKTHHIGWPSQLPASLEHHFVRGFFDGDGSWICMARSRIKAPHLDPIVQFDGTAGFAVNSAFTPEFIDRLFRLTGLLFHSTDHKSPVIKQVRIHGRKKMIVFGDWLYRDSKGLRLERKHQKYLDTKSFYN